MVMTCTVSPRWFFVSLRTVAVPRSGRDFDGLSSSTSLTTVSTSPGRVGRGHSMVPPEPMMPPSSGRPDLHQQLHGDRHGVPAARREAAEQRALRRLIVEMKRLRVELAGKGLDLRGIDCVAGAGEALPDGKIVEREGLYRGVRHGLLPRRSPAFSACLPGRPDAPCYLHDDSY